MLIVLNEQTGMSADKPRKEIIASSASELDDIEVGHGSIAYAITDATLNVYDEESGEWAEVPTGGGGGGGGNAPWFVDKEAVLLYTAEKEWKLSETNYPSLTPSSSSQILKFPATEYTVAPHQNATFDRWGADYHGGSALDFNNYDYVIIRNTLIDVAYIGDESNFNYGHVMRCNMGYCTNTYSKVAVDSNNQLIIPSSSAFSGIALITAGVSTYLKYRDASKNIKYYVGGQGITISQSSASLLPQLTNPSVSYVNFNADTVNIKTTSTYMNAYSDVDADNTKIITQAKLYQVKKPSSVEYAYIRTANSLLNGTLPTD